MTIDILSLRPRFGRQDSDHLPEWASDDPSERGGGTFDSAGKFRTGSSVEKKKVNGDDEDSDDQVRVCHLATGTFVVHSVSRPHVFRTIGTGEILDSAA